MPREIVTIQLGPQASWVGAHFWNFQDDSLHPEMAADGSPDPDAADPAVLYRSGGGERQSTRTPRLVVCDRSDGFGSLGAQGRRVPTAGSSCSGGQGGEPPPVDPLAWGGGVTTVTMEAVEPSPFVRTLYAGAGRADEDEGEEGEEGDEGDEGEEGEEGEMERRRSPRPTATPAVEVEEGGSAPSAAAFDFEATAAYWSDYLQAQLHSRSVAPLRPHSHNFSQLELWSEGESLMRREEAALDGDSPALLERTRRFLEECDKPQGFLLLADVDGAFGGLGSALLTRIRDEMSAAPCLALGLGTCPAPQPHSQPHTACVAALNDALALTAFGELRSCYVPLVGHASAADPPRPPLVRPASPSAARPCRYTTSALPAAWLDVVTLPLRTRGESRGGLTRLLGGLQVAPRFHLGSPVLGLPLPPPTLGEVEPTGRRAWSLPSGGVFSPTALLCPLAPWQLPPLRAIAFSQSVSCLGFPPQPLAAVSVIPPLLPCRSSMNVSIFTRTAPLSLPLPFPQFFTPDLGSAGELLPPALDRAPRPFAPRREGEEVFSLPATAALQSSPAIGPLVQRVAEEWAAQRRAAEHRLAAEWGADELAEVTEDLLALRDAYATGDADGSESNGSED